MPDDEPQPSKKPFIRFKQHVDARIGTGISVITGRSRTTTATAPTPPTTSSSQPEPPPSQQPTTAPAESTETGAPQITTRPTNTTTAMPRPPLEPCPPSFFSSRDTAQYWSDWTQLSPYSPYNLRHLPQPVPNDLPADAAADAHLFGFDDAFEDLLASTTTTTNNAGWDPRPLPLMDLRRQARYKRQVRTAFPTGEPPVLWLNRLREQGLLRRPLPPVNLAQAHPELVAASDQWALRRGVQLLPGEGREEGEEEEEERQRRRLTLFGTRLTDEESELLQQIEGYRRGRRRGAAWDPEEEQWRLREQLEKVDQKMKEFEEEMERLKRERDEGKTPAPFPWDKLLSLGDGNEKTRPQEQQQQQQPATEEDFWPPQRVVAQVDRFIRTCLQGVTETPRKEQEQERQDKQQQQQQQQPDTEDDLFSMVESAFARADKSFKDFVKVILPADDKPAKDQDGKGPWSAAPWVPAGRVEEPKPREVVEHDEFGGRTIRSTSEHVDMFGHVHQTTKVKRLDADGREVSRETRYSIRPFSEKEKQAPKRFEEVESTASATGDEKKKAVNNDASSSGWFWR